MRNTNLKNSPAFVANTDTLRRAFSLKLNLNSACRYLP